jgi:hypothetical protein
MVDVRVVRMPVPKRFMPAPVRMRLRHRSFVSMVMMRIVEMAVLVLDCLVHVFMGMPFGQMQPDAERHQQTRGDQLQSDRLDASARGTPGQRGFRAGKFSDMDQFPTAPHEKCNYIVA